MLQIMYKLRADRFDYQAGTVVYKFLGLDYGCRREDEQMTGMEHLVVTTDPKGYGEFFTIPLKYLSVHVGY